MKSGGRSSVSVGFAPTARSSGYTRATIPSSSSSSSLAASSESAVGLVELIKHEAENMGEENCPVYIAADSAGFATNMDIDIKPVDILNSSEHFILFQLPVILPEINSKVDIDVEAETEKKTEEWPESIEGEYGSLCIHESGRLSLLVNDVRYFLDLGNNPFDTNRFIGAQSIVAIDPEYEQSFELGQIQNSFIGSIDLESIIPQL